MQQARLNEIAAEVPTNVDTYAKKTAQAQPDVTRALGRDGVRGLRDALSAAADELADELRSSVDKVKWRGERDAKSAIFSFLYGSRMTKFDMVFQRLGYKVHEHSGISPYELFERPTFADIDRELAVLKSIENEVEQAKAADDHDAVESLWDDEPS